MSTTRTLPASLGALLLLGTVAAAQAAPRPWPTLVRNVRLEPSEEAAPVSILLRDGRISAILEAEAPTPPGVRVVEGEGALCLPGFVDAYTRTGCETPQPVKDQDAPVETSSDVRVDMRLANRKGIQPAFRAAEALAIDEGASEAWRESGFGAALVAPGGELLAGSSAVASTREAAMRDLVVRPDAFAHGAFRANGPGYPSTLMGYVAQLRQFFLDAERHAELEERHAAGRPGPRPPFDPELQAGTSILRGDMRLVCAAQSHRDVERWLKLADEFGFELAVSGGRDAWRVRDVLSERGLPVILTLDWGEEVEDVFADEEEADERAPQEDREDRPEEAEGSIADPAAVEGSTESPEEETEAEDEPVWEYQEPLGVRQARRVEWEEGRDCAIQLHEAGVPFAFGTDEDKPKKLLERVRELVEAGLPRDAALAALTADAAAILGVGDRLGRIEAGYDATLALWDGDPLTEKKAETTWVFVDGFPTEFERDEEAGDELPDEGPAEGVDPTGSWSLTFETHGRGIESADLEIEMDDDGTLTGTITVENSRDDTEVEAEVEGRVAGSIMRLEATIDFGGFELETVLTGTIDGDEISGDGTFAFGGGEARKRPLEGVRNPDLEGARG